ncbi:hypothetical protein WN944_005567 [Citrus x changshan-huyou]|uniref:Uncharacterized protein n=1 Tax=Citrus x changshan-huyou TaxID=2935761 RepID=A0AAP0M2I5_9ROSI
MNLKLALFAVVCVLAFALTKAAVVPAGVKEDDFAPPPPVMLEVEGPENKDGIGQLSITLHYVLLLEGTVNISNPPVFEY